MIIPLKYPTLNTRYSDVEPAKVEDCILLEQLRDIVYACRLRRKEPDEIRIARKDYAAVALCDVSEAELMFISSLKGYMSQIPKESVLSMMKAAGVVVKEKQLRASDWRERLTEKLLFRLHKPILQTLFQDMVRQGCQRLYIRIKELHGGTEGFLKTFQDPSEYKGGHLILDEASEEDELKPFEIAMNKVAYYSTCRFLDQDKDCKQILATFTNADWSVYETEVLQAYFYARGARDLAAGRFIEITKNEAVQKAESLARIVEEEREQKRFLRRHLESVNQSAETQLEEALNTISELEKENNYLHERIYVLERQLKSSQSTTAPILPNTHHHVLVVGHPAQKDMYEEELAKRNATFEFFPAVLDGGVNIHQLKGLVKRADQILFITTFSQHKVLAYLEATADREKIRYLNCRGRQSFIRELERVFA